MRLVLLSILAVPIWSQTPWKALYDGRSLSGWRAPFIQNAAESSWEITEGYLHPVASTRKADLWTTATYRNFVLEFEFKLAAGANGGIKYLIQRGVAFRRRGDRLLPAENTAEEPGDEYVEGTGALEFQIVDDAGEEAKDPKGRAGAIYGLVAPRNPPPIGPGVLHRGRLVVQGDRIEHYLDGQLVLQVTLGSPEMEAAWDASKEPRIRALRSQRSAIRP
jgi:hypothetical protein